MYDKYGLEGVKNGGGGMGGFEDLFDIFGGGGRRRQARKREMKVKPTVKQVTITLEDAYNGKSTEVKNRRTTICAKCDGKGGENVKTCGDCGGHGVVMKTMQIGPGMYQRTQAACSKCRGKGKVKIIEVIFFKFIDFFQIQKIFPKKFQF